MFESLSALKDLYGTNVNLIGEIEDAYIMTRYYDTNYEAAEVKNMIDFCSALPEEIEKRCRRQ